MSKITAKGFLKRLVGFSMASYIGAIITFVSTFINTRIFSTSDLGIVNLFLTIQNSVVFIAFFGVDQAYCRYYYECQTADEKNQLFWNCLGLSSVVALVIGTVLLIAWRPLSIYIGGTPSIFPAVALFISVFAHVICRYVSLLSRMQYQILSYTLLTVVTSIANKLSYSVSSLISNDYLTSIIAIAVVYTIITIVLVVVLGKRSIEGLRHAERNKTNIKKLLRYGAPLMPISLLSWLNASIPIFIIKESLSYEALGIYTNTITLTSAINLLQSGFNTFWVPFYCENYKDENAKLQKIHDVLTGTLVGAGLILCLVRPILYYFVGEAYRSGSTVFPYLLISPILYTIGETTGIGINISEKSYLHGIAYFGGILSNYILCRVLIPIYGITGAGISVAASAMVSFILKTLIGEKYYRCVKSYIKSFSTIILFFIAAFCDSYMHINVFLIRMIYLLCIFALFLIYKREIRQMMRTLNNIVLSRHKTSSE